VVCLGEFNDGELVRLPCCEHPFHAPCIDTWLRLARCASDDVFLLLRDVNLSKSQDSFCTV
jgi:hypothetical protein